MWKRTFFAIYVCLLGWIPSAVAQQLPAEDIIDRTAAAFRQAGGVQTTFMLQTYLKETLQDSFTGTICLKGEKFLLDAGGMKTWFDGHTQWTYLINSDEVNITEPTPEEVQSINPYAWLYLYKSGYHLNLGKANAYKGQSAYEIILTASDKKQDLQAITMHVTKDSYQPLGIIMLQRDGTKVSIHTTSYKTKQAYPDAFFAFDKKAYPTAEVIDLR